MLLKQQQSFGVKKEKKSIDEIDGAIKRGSPKITSKISNGNMSSAF